MAVNWNAIATKIRTALKKDFPNNIIVTVTIAGEYDIATGKTPAGSVTPYPTNGAVKSYEVKDFVNIAPEEIEIVFHPGTPANPIPDLTDKQHITITAAGKIYKVKNIRAVRPAGVTLLYKAIAVESKDVEE
jgi:hypothetical protein